jgi:hypothetical protein
MSFLVTTGCSKNPIAGGSGHSGVSIAPESILNLPGIFSITASNSSNGSVGLNWSASNKATSYIVKYKTEGAATYSEKPVSTNLSDTLNSIADNQKYYIQIVAVNSYGTSTSNTIIITPVNLDVAPIASNITPSGVLENISASIQLPYTDANGDLATSCSVTSPSMISISSNCTCNAGGFCTVGVLGNTNYSGAASFQYTITANGVVSNIASASFTIAAVNNAPTISAIANQTINEDNSTSALAFTINDVDNTLTCAGSVAKSSTNAALLDAASGMVIGGTAPNCTLTLSPVANANGVTTVSLTVSDGSLTEVKTFVLTVNAVNDAPTMSSITNQTINEDTSSGALSFTINDVDNTLTCAGSVSKASSNSALLDATSGIIIGGTTPNCTVTLNPVANANGVTTITLTVGDGSLSQVKTFSLTVNAVNDAPVISAIANQTINEDSSTSALAFTINDVDNTLTCAGSVIKASSNSALLDATSGIVIGGSAPNCTVTLSPVANANGVTTVSLTVSDGSLTDVKTFSLTVNAVNDAPTMSSIANQVTNEDTSISGIAFTINDVDNTLNCVDSVSKASSSASVIDATSGIVIGGTAPNCTVTLNPIANASGIANITLTVSDGSLTQAKNFSLTVNPINDAPVISAISGLATLENVATAPIAFTIADVDNTLTCAGAVSATSSDTAILANADIVIGGTAPNCTVVLTPTTNMNGVATITLTVTDGSLSATSPFTLSIGAVNQPPAITAISNQTTNEDTSTSAISFNITDPDNTLTCAGSVTKASSNSALLDATSGIVIGGTAPNCTVTMNPVANANGVTNVTLTVTDGALTATRIFSLTVAAVNDAPTMSSIANQTTNEDTSTSAIAFTINDVDNTLSCAGSISKASSNSALLDATSGIVIGGAAPDCTVTLNPVANANGTANVTLTVTDGSLTAARTFSLTVNAVNDAPVISVIANQTTNEDTVTGAIAFTITDIDNTLTCAGSVTKISTNSAVLDATSGITIGGTAPNCTATLNPVANASGTSTITLTVSDGALTASSAFSLTVTAVNDAPTISFIANQTTNEDTAAIVSFTIADIDSSPAMNCTSANISLVSSSNGTLIPGVIGSDIVLGGTYPNCTATITPAANQYGTSNIILRVTDNGAPGSPLTVDSNTFILTVTAVNDAPTITTIANQTTNEDTAINSIAFTINDVDNTLTCAGSVLKDSSNSALINATSGITVSGTAPNCFVSLNPVANANGSATVTLTVTDGSLTTGISFSLTVNPINDAPTIGTIAAQTINEDGTTGALNFAINDIDSTLTCIDNVSKSSSNTTVLPNSYITVGGTYPNCTVTVTPPANMNGTSTITLTVFDGFLSATSSFLVTINAVNDAPTVSAISNQTTDEDVAITTLPFTILDVDSAIDCTTSMTKSSSNAALIATAGIQITGSYPNCNVALTPVANASGTSTITLTVSDTLLTASTTFVLTVNAVNDAPVITAVANQTILEDAATAALAVSFSDVDNTLTCASLTATSSNTALVANGSPGIVIAGTWPACTIKLTPLANANGASTITLSVTDGILTTTSTFVLNVTAVNDAPTITAITAKTTDEDVASSAITFTIADVDSAITCANVTGTSSNTTIVPNANIVITGAAQSCTAVVTGALNKNGTVNITLTVSDGALSATSVFALTIIPVPDISGTLTAAANLSGVASSTAANTYGRTILFTGLTVDEAVKANGVEVCLGTAAGVCDLTTWAVATGYTGTTTLGGSFKLTSNSAGIANVDKFTLAQSCSAAAVTNYYYSMRVTSSANNRTSAVISTPAWSFWEPSCLTSTVLAQWLDASDISANTTTVSTWSDKSGNGRNVTAVGTPTYSATGFGGSMPGVTFNGTSTSFTATGFAYGFTSVSYFAAIQAASSGGSSKYVFSEGTSTSSSNYYAPLANSSADTLTGRTVDTSGTNLALTTTGLPFFDGAIHFVMTEDTKTKFTPYSDGVVDTAVNYTRGPTSFNKYCLGARYKTAAASSWFAGTIGEFIITKGTLSAADRQKLEGYSAHKWGQNTVLPTAPLHPHRSIPPLY